MEKKTVVIQTKLGQLRGLVCKSILTEKDFYSFRGIPYGKPPLGELRFKAAQPFGSWVGVRDALDNGPDPKQPPMGPIEVPGMDLTANDEDCLYINVYMNEERKYNSTQRHNRLKCQNKKTKNKFSISMQVKKMQKHSTFTGAAKNDQNLTKLNTHSSLPASDNEDSQMIQVKVMVHREQNSSINEAENLNKPPQQPIKTPPCTSRVKAPNETFEGFFAENIEYYKIIDKIYKDQVYFSPSYSLSTTKRSIPETRMEESNSNNEHQVNNSFLAPAHRKMGNLKYKSRVFRKCLIASKNP
ncbi:Cocaine esterase [Homalodisca vitripennis]|nr:Cocaine esterase [Homalodisca vitripennis]